jgi:hypothetical protein
LKWNLHVRVLLLFPALVFLSASCAAEGDRVPVGIVDRVDGRWQRAQDRRQLVRGELLFDDETVTIEHTESGSLEVLLFHSQGAIWHQDCSRAKPCEGSYRPPGDDSRKSSFWAFLSSYWNEGHRLPEITLGSRGIEGNMLSDVVVVRSGQSTDLAPALKKVPPGSYNLKLTPAPDSASVKSLTPHELTLEIKRDKAAQVDGLNTGLYVAALSRADGDTLGSSKLLLVAAESNRPLLDKWRDIEKTAEEWSADHPDTVEILLARALYSLDAEYPATH